MCRGEGLVRAAGSQEGGEVWGQVVALEAGGMSFRELSGTAFRTGRSADLSRLGARSPRWGRACLCCDETRLPNAWTYCEGALLGERRGPPPSSVPLPPWQGCTGKTKSDRADQAALDLLKGPLWLSLVEAHVLHLVPTKLSVWVRSWGPQKWSPLYADPNSSTGSSTVLRGPWAAETSRF